MTHLNTLVFKYGFELKGMKYGWYKKKLYRLPSTINFRNYTLKEMSEILIGYNIGFRLMKKKYTIKQLKEITIPILELKIDLIKQEDLPF